MDFWRKPIPDKFPGLHKKIPFQEFFFTWPSCRVYFPGTGLVPINWSLSCANQLEVDFVPISYT